MKHIVFINEYSSFLNEDTMFNLGISPLAGLLLNNVFNFKFRGCSPKVRSYWRGAIDSYDDVRGGGLLVQCDPRITVDNMNRIGIIFKNRWKVGSYIRVADGKAEIIKSVKDKLANALKEYWRANPHVTDKEADHVTVHISDGIIDRPESSSDDTNKKYLYTATANADGVIPITYNMYRALYEYLKGRNMDKARAKYGKDAVDAIMSKEITNQFIILAIEGTQNEIKKIQEEFKAARIEENKKFDQEVEELRTAYRKHLDEMEAASKAKVKELEDQLEQLTTMGEKSPVEITA